MVRIWIVFWCCLFTFFLNHAQENEFEKIDSKRFKRLYKINDYLYRSEQPSKKGFKELEASGIKTILNLRRAKNDSSRAKGRDLLLLTLPLKAKELNEKDIIDGLKAIQDSPKPVLVHCWHGSDRTGALVAAYRIVVEDWPKEKAIKEFRYKDFGYHEKMYPNLVPLLEQLDINKVREAIGM